MNLNHTPRLITKPWGTEQWEVLSKDFCVKTIWLIKGAKTSYQWHRQKEEVNFIRAGEAEVWLEDEKGVVQKHFLRPGDSFFVPAGRKHRVIALTDLEMFEVSNEFVDDVVRINDEFGRGDGKIEAEHQVPAVLILAAGLGSRLKQHTAHKNKALLPLANKAVISHVIEKFPASYEIVVAVGYQKDSLIEYCQLAHPERRFRFVEAEGWDNPATDPGHSAWACREFLQRPFYLCAVDSIIEGSMPHMDGNWLGVYPTDCPERYATVNSTEGRVSKVVNKGPVGFNEAFIGVAAIRDHGIFWSTLGLAAGHELVKAWATPDLFALKAKTLRWFDAGNLDDLRAAREHFGGEPLSSPKQTEEVVYRVGNRILKFHPDHIVSTNRLIRAKALGELAPSGLAGGGNFIAYDWQPGKNLYHCGPDVHRHFLSHFTQRLRTQICEPSMAAKVLYAEEIYRKKTAERTSLFTRLYGESYFAAERTINGVRCASLLSLMGRINFQYLCENTLFIPGFHGDLHFDNVIYSEATDRFTYIDWRESFGSSTAAGDLYYDLGKLYAGTLVPCELLKDDRNVTLSEGSTVVTYHYDIPDSLREFKRTYEDWLIEHRYDLGRVKLVAALAFINIAPLHGDVWGKVLLFRGIELLDEILG